MYFINGNYIMGGNFKIKKAAPMDDRGTVAKKIDLQNPNLFDGFTYNGMIVSVVDDTINNGLYRLEDKSTLTWKKEGSDVNFTASLRDKLMKVSDNNRGAVSNETALASIANPMEGDFALVRSTLTFWAYESGAWVDTHSSTTAGSDGLSAYELDVLTNGYSGTLEQWLIDLKGEPGTNFEYKDFLKDFSINGKHFDENNNIELDGHSMMSSPELNLEKLTEYRHPVTKKPIYSKTFSVGPLPINTTKSINIDLSTAEDFWIDQTNSYANRPDINISIPMNNPIFINNIGLDKSRIIIGTIRTDANIYTKAYVCVLYTKLADTSTSPVKLVGTPTPKEVYDQLSFNGVKPDEYGNVELEGVSTLVSPELNLEKLTEYRHPVTKKPLYTKTIDFGYLPNNATKVVPHNVPNIEDTIIDYSNSYIYIPGIKGFSFSGFSVWSAVAYQIGSYVDNGSIVVGTGNDRTNMKAIFTINYTKTTDTAESPVRLIGGGGTGGDVDLTNYYKKSETYNKVETDSLVDTKQDTLVSGTSIKTINGQSVLGNGNIFVTAEVDLSNYYTKPQVDGFINEINTELGSMVILGAYGLRWNQETDVYEALGSVNRRQIQGNMKRCVLKDDGTVNYYLNPTNSTQKAQGGTAVLTGADGNVMVEVPKFWYKHTLVGDTHEWWVSNTPLAGYSVHPWFLEGGVERPFRYYRAYTPTVVGGKLRSISGSTPTRSQTRATFRTQARANGAGWNLCSWNAVNAIQILFLTEYCTFNSQAVLGRGNDAGGDYGITTGQSNGIGNASSVTTNNDMWMSYRGIENWYADCYEFIDGTNVQNYKVYLNQNPATFADDVFTGDYVDSGVTVPAMLGSYTKKISGNFLPTAVGGSSSTYMTDVGWSATGDRVVSFGGTADNGLFCGAFCWNAYPTVSSSNTYLGAGLSR